MSAFPVVVLTGARQAGKSTLVRHLGRGTDRRYLTLDDLEARLDAMQTAWSEHLAGLDAAAITRSFDYRATEGDRYRNFVEDVLTQLFGHSWYHRGQIALLVRDLGGEPAVTDFVFWTRTPLSD